MISVEIKKEDLANIKRELGKLNVKSQDSIFRKALTKANLAVEDRLKTAVGGEKLRVRSGRLRSSLGSIVIEEGESIIGLIGSGVRQGDRVSYANIQETGGTIRPRVAKYLAIPLPAALTRAGVAKKSPRDYTNTFVMRSKSGSLIIAQKTGSKSGKVVALFVLKKSVTIPASHYMSDIAGEMSDKVVDIMINKIRQEVEKK